MAEEDLIDDQLIHDDMDIADFEEEDLEYGSLIIMDAWLTQAADSTPTSTTNNSDKSTKSTATKLDKSAHASVNLIEKPSANAL